MAAAPDCAPAEADRASAEVTRELDLRAREILLQRLHSLEAAAARIAAGTYGQCEGCGEAIPMPRLLASPEAALCAPCQNAREGARTG